VPLGTVKSRTYDALHALRQEIGMKYHADEQARHGGRPG
jgi:DNA-directed RNA polymerase specialized sigma24 family protein